MEFITGSSLYLIVFLPSKSLAVLFFSTSTVISCVLILFFLHSSKSKSSESLSLSFFLPSINIVIIEARKQIKDWGWGSFKLFGIWVVGREKLNMINNLIIITMDLYSLIVGSSTPDGLAPLSQTGVIVFVATLGVLPLIWAALNFVQLLRRPMPESQENEGEMPLVNKEHTVFMLLCQHILEAAVSFLKYNFTVSLVAGVIFFFIILGAIQNFDEPTIALAYLYGLIESIFIGVAVSLASQIGLSRVSFAAVDSVFAAHVTTRNVSNFTAYFVTSFTTLIFALLLLLSEDSSGKMNKNDIQQLGRELIAFAFGISTAAIGTKINSVVYGKAAEGALSLITQLQPRIPRNHTNPVIICKAAGQNVRKIVSNALDYNMYLAIALTCATSAAGSNIIGADQKGEIIFDYSIYNIYLPLLAILFMLFFSLLANVLTSLLLSPDTGDEAAIIFKREIYLVMFFLTGFLALAAYLCLPIEFFLDEMPNELKAPYLGYLILLISVFVMFGLMLVGELQANHPRFVYELINTSKGGVARNIVEGLSVGYLGNAGPVIIWAGILFLSYFWLGSFGASLAAIGAALLIPNYLNINTYFALVETGSFVSYIGQLGEDSLTNLMTISQNRKLYEIQIHSHFTSLALTANYAIVLNYVAEYELTRIPLTSASILAGLFIGAMIIYAFGSTVLFAIQNAAPVLCLDLKAQGQENPGILSGMAEPDLSRSNFIFNLNTILQLKYFLPFLYVPFLLLGLAFGPRMTLGMVIGMGAAGLQLAFSSGLSGTVWNSARAQIFLGRAKDDENQQIKAQSQCGKAADVGNEVGMRLKDAIGSSVHGYIIFTSLTNAVMAALYVQLH